MADPMTLPRYLLRNAQRSAFGVMLSSGNASSTSTSTLTGYYARGKVRGAAGRGWKDLHDVRAFAPRRQHFRRGEATEQRRPAGIAGKLAHALHHAGGNQIVRSGFQAGLRGVEVEHGTGADQKILTGTSA